MRKLWAITWKEVYSRFTDRNLLLIMVAAPLAIASIIGLAFGGLASGSSPVSHIPVAVVNHDADAGIGVSMGAVLEGLLVQGQLPQELQAFSASDCPQPAGGSQSDGTSLSLDELVDGTAFNPARVEALVEAGSLEASFGADLSMPGVDAAARAAVDKGLYSAVVIIPAEFSAGLTRLAQPASAPEAVQVTVYGNQGRDLDVSIVKSLVDGIVGRLISGNIAIGATFSELAAAHPEALTGAQNLDFGQLFACAFMPGGDVATLVDQAIQAASASPVGGLLVGFGSAQAMFFALFTAEFGVLSMYEERRTGTLQRLLISPTPRWTILGGKLVGVMASVAFQLLVLIVALTLVDSLLEGKLTMIWGTNVPLLLLTVLAATTSVSGLGMLLAGVLKGLEQANVVGSVLNIALGVLGGGFGFQLPRAVAGWSMIYWGRDAFAILASGHGDLTLDLVILFVQGAAMFGLGLVLFTRRFQI